MDENRPKTVDAVRLEIENAKRVLRALTFHNEYTITDYPIGRRVRGQCKLGVERGKKGSRTIKQTTDKHGRWCKPKLGLWGRCIEIVATGLEATGLEHDAGWLSISEQGIFASGAAGKCATIASAPHYTRPRREASTYTTTTHLLFGGGEVNRTQHTLDADPPALCDAWDEWSKRVAELIVTEITPVMEQLCPPGSMYAFQKKCERAMATA